jgi:hypothetical protein
MIFSQQKRETEREGPEYLKISNACTWTTVKAPLRNARDLFPVPLAGEKIAEVLTGIYRQDEKPEPDRKPVRPAQRANILPAFRYDCTELNVLFGDSGFKRQESEDTRTPYRYREKQLCDGWKTRGFNAMDDMLDFMEKNADSYPEYMEPDNYTQSRNSIIRNTAQVNEICFINHSRLTWLRLKPHFKTVEETVIAPRTGGLYQQLKTEPASPQATEEKWTGLRDASSAGNCLLRRTPAFARDRRPVGQRPVLCIPQKRRQRGGYSPGCRQPGRTPGKTGRNGRPVLLETGRKIHAKKLWNRTRFRQLPRRDSKNKKSFRKMKEVKIEYPFFIFRKTKTVHVPEEWIDLTGRQIAACAKIFTGTVPDVEFISAFFGIKKAMAKRVDKFCRYKLIEPVEFIASPKAPVNFFYLPEIPGTGLTAPGKRLKNVNFEHFSLFDTFFFDYINGRKKESQARFTAALYLKKGETVTAIDFTERVDFIAKNVSKSTRYAIFPNCTFIRKWLSKPFPYLFGFTEEDPDEPKKKSVQGNRTVRTGTAYFIMNSTNKYPVL